MKPLSLVLAAAIGMLLAALALAQAPARTRLANPASKFCVDKGGTPSIERSGKGGEFGVCTFPENRQCEEWAMLRGECPTGGIKVTGYVTSAARYCAITGGTYSVTAGSNTASERGNCSFKTGRTCAADAYFNGTCTREKAAGASASTPKSRGTVQEIRASFHCDGGKSVEAIFINGPQSSVKVTLSDGRMLSLPQTMSGSGARYANAGDRIVFWNKGNTAFIEENGTTTFSGCVAKG